MDATGQPHAEELLQQAQESERIRLIFETALDAVITMNDEGLITDWNSEAERAFGWRRDEVLGRRMADIIIPLRYRDAHEQGLRTFLDTGHGPVLNRRIEITALRRGGDEFPVELAIAPAIVADRWTFAAFIRDITERKQAVEGMALLASIVEFSDDSIIGTDLDGTILSWNTGSERFWGYTAAEAVGKNVSILFPDRRSQEYANAVEKIKHGESIERYESVRVRKDGTPVAVSVILSPIKDSHARLLGVSAIYRDITKRKEADAELLRAKAAAEAASQAKSEFLANMSHEIRTPLNGIMGMVGITLNTELTAEQREYLVIAQSSVDSLARIIDDILDYSKIEAHKLDLESAEFNLRNVVETAIKMLTVHASQKQTTLTWQVMPDVPQRVVGDPGRLQQILVNLLGNGVKFTERGEVRLHVEKQLETTEGVVLHFSVSDTGIGIAAEKQQLVFQSFTQADNSTTRRFGGTGLGLAIASQLVELMGGRIWLESEVDKGSTFHFTVRLGLTRQA